MTLSQPRVIAASAPARSGSQTSARSAFSLRRGSSTMSFAPWDWAMRIALYSIVQLCRRGSWPMSTMHFELRMSPRGNQP